MKKILLKIKRHWLLFSVIFISIVILVVIGILSLSTHANSNYSNWSDQGIINSPIASDAYYPSAIYDAGGFGVGSDKYAMWYSDGNGAVFLIKSSDGVIWGAPTVMTGITNAHHAQVLYSESCFGTVPCNIGTIKYRMWFWDMSAPTIYSISSLATAESADGVNWVNQQAVTQDSLAKLVQDPDSGSGWNRGTYGPVNLFYQSSASNSGTEPWNYSYVMYYNGTDGSHEDTGLAYSADGFIWSAYTINPVLSGTNSGGANAWNCGSATYGTVYKDFSGYHFWYSGRGEDDGGGGCAFPSSFVGIGYAFSPDSKNWTKDTSSIFNINDGVSYRSGRVYTPSVINDGSGILRMYFTVKDSIGGPKKIAYATLPTPRPPNPPSAYTYPPIVTTPIIPPEEVTNPTNPPVVDIDVCNGTLEAMINDSLPEFNSSWGLGYPDGRSAWAKAHRVAIFNLYQEILNRKPCIIEVNWWLQTEPNIDNIRNNIFNSDEYLKNHPNIKLPETGSNEEAFNGSINDRIYLVKAGDYLKLIAEKVYGDANQYQKIIDLNQTKYPTLLSNPNFISEGWQLNY